MTLSTVPGMTVLGSCDTLAICDSSSALLADFDMRGSAISFWTRANTSFSGAFLRFFIGSFPRSSSHPLDNPNDQTNEQKCPKNSISKHGGSCFNSTDSFLKVALTVNSFPHQICSVADMSGIRFLNFSGLRTIVGC